MKALSLTQPWASLVALGQKKIETRSWSTRYRGLLAIHASKGFPVACKELCEEEQFAQFFPEDGDIPLGAVVAIVHLKNCVRIPRRSTASFFESLSRQEEAFGDYRPRRFAWTLELIKRFDRPIPAKGHLGLWEWKEPVAATEGI